ncbi:MAG TPA: hypothetical protein VMM13_18835 [Euzebya sp.]|nr:hypothetical protein [Euzebya sp.]
MLAVLAAVVVVATFVQQPIGDDDGRMPGEEIPVVRDASASPSPSPLAGPTTGPETSPTWTLLPPAPLPPGTPTTAVAHGSTLLVWDHAGSGRMLRLLLDVGWDGRWVEGAVAPLRLAGGHVMVPTPHGILVTAGTDLAGQASTAALRYDPRQDLWERLPDLPGGGRLSPGAAWVEPWSSLVVWGGVGADGTLAADGRRLLLDPPNDTVVWAEAPVPDLGLQPRRDPHVMPTTDGYAVWGGRDEAGAWLEDGAYVGDGGVISVPDDPPRRPARAAAVTAGRELITWGAPDDPLLRPGWRWSPSRRGSSAAWHAAAPELGVDAPRADPSMVVTRRIPPEGGRLDSLQLVVFGGASPASGAPRTDALLVDVSSGEARRLPPAPLAGRTGETLAWTGERLIVWGGRSDGTPQVDGATTELPPLP